MKNLKKLLPILLTLSALLLTGTAALASAEAAYTNSATGYRVYVADEADLLSETEEEEVITAMVCVTDYGHALFLTTDTNPYGTSDYTDEYTVRYAQEYYYNLLGNDDGVVILVDMDNRIVTLQSCGNIYKTITDGRADSITDNIYRYASRGDYAGLAVEGFSEVASLLEGERIAQPMKHLSNAFLALICGLFICFLIVRASCGLTQAEDGAMLKSARVLFKHSPVQAFFVRESRRYDPPASSGGGGHGGGGHFGGGGGGFSGGGGHGGGGGGFSGGGGSHRF